MNTAKTWILVGNACTAKLYESHNIGRELNLIKEFSHPKSRTKGADLVTDKVGHYQAKNGMGQGSFIAVTEPKDVEVERFAKELASELNTGRTSHCYDRLVVIMPPNLHGKLNKACNEQVLGKVIHHIEKDYTNLQDRQLIDILDDLARY